MGSKLSQSIQKAAQALKERQTETVSLNSTRPQLSAGDQDLVQSLCEGLRAWRHSAEGEALIAKLSTLSPEDIALSLKSVLGSAYLAPSMALLAKPDDLNLSFPVQSVSIGLVGQFDVILAGLVLSVGYAADLNNVGGTAKVYLGGGVTAGLEIGADIGVEVGVWRNKVADMQGNYTAEELEVVDDGGFILTGYQQKEQLAGITLSLDVGGNDGIAVEDYYIFTFDISHSPVYQDSDAAHFLVLTTLTCLNNNIGTDDVYLTFRPDGGTTYRYPTWGSYEMTQDDDETGHSWGLGRSVKFNSYVDVQLQVGADDFPKIRFNYSDFNGIGSNVTKTADRDGSIGNGWNEIKYQLGAYLMA